MSTKKVINNSISDKISQISQLRLKKARKESGFSQQEIADYLGKGDRTSISNIENGKSNPSVEDMFLLSIKYGKSPSWLGAMDVLYEEIKLEERTNEFNRVNDKLNELEYQVTEIEETGLPKGANLQDLRYASRLIQSFLESFDNDSD